MNARYLTLLRVLVLWLGLPLAALHAQPSPAPSSSSAPSSDTPPAASVPAPSAPALSPPPAPASVPPPARAGLKDVYARVVDSVVRIETEYGTGSGFFFKNNRLIATALHVVDDAETIIVQVADGRRSAGRVVAYSRKHDVALVELEGPVDGAKVLAPFDGVVDIGENVLVIGHPFSGLEDQVPELRGLLNWSLTQGVVSAVTASWLQTDAAINPGNSGGPVLNARGEVLGVVSAKLSNAQGISVAARIGRVAELVPKIDQQPPPRHHWRFEGLELGFIAQISRDTIEGFTLGGGSRLFKRYPLRLRVGLLAGNVQAHEATVLETHLVRVTSELTMGVALPLGPVELSPALGAAFFYDHETNSSLRIDDVACEAPPCLVNGKVERSSEGSVHFLPTAQISLDFHLLRVGYAYEIALAQALESQHRVLIAVIF
jgi:S1-C subfamily serine protease